MKGRRANAYETRQATNDMSNERPHPRHISNGDEQKFRHEADKKYKPSLLMSYSKGLPHDENTGLVLNPDDFQYFVKAIDSGDSRDFRDTPLGHPHNCLGGQCHNDEFDWKSDKAMTGKNGGPVDVRAWESQSAGNSYEMQGPDAQAVTMPPAPKLGSAELTAEIAEVYAQAILRDVPFHTLTKGVMGFGSGKTEEDISINSTLSVFRTDNNLVQEIKSQTDILKELDWFKGTSLKLDIKEIERRRDTAIVTPATAFRGITHGDDIGPYLSQFLLVGNTGINGNDPERSPRDGMIFLWRYYSGTKSSYC